MSIVYSLPMVLALLKTYAGYRGPAHLRQYGAPTVTGINPIPVRLDVDLQRTYRGRAWRDEEPNRRLLLDTNVKEKAVLIASLNCSAVEEADRLTEMGDLLRTAGATVVHRVVQHPDPRLLYLGKGRLEAVVPFVMSAVKWRDKGAFFLQRWRKRKKEKEERGEGKEKTEKLGGFINFSLQ